MSLSVVFTRANQGVDAPLVTVETHLSNGIPSLSMVGLPETAVKESRERVRCAILNAGLEFPARRITINMAPADIPKSGGRYDLAIALSILAASEQISSKRLQSTEILGELALAGDVRGVQGVLPAVIAARDVGRSMLIPARNSAEAAVVREAQCYAVQSLREACQHFADDSAGLPTVPSSLDGVMHDRPGVDPLAAIRGQQHAKRALCIAAAGGHNMLMIGPPGTGKTLLANALPGLLPMLDEAQALEAAAVRSVAGLPVTAALWAKTPFRAPHHGASSVAIVGGGRQLNPGEITLAHAGVLFLDELTEFKRHVLESMREPLEAGTVTISRADYRVTFPANFQLICAMNPCPCGYFGDSKRQCSCTAERIGRYLEKISGPLLDRIDLHVEVARLDYEQLMGEAEELNSDAAAWTPQLIRQCRERQIRRNGCLNAQLSARQLHDVCPLSPGCDALLKKVVETMKLSARACHRIIKLARTIADMQGCQDIRPEHIAEAASYRGLNLPGATPAP